MHYIHVGIEVGAHVESVVFRKALDAEYQVFFETRASMAWCNGLHHRAVKK